MCISKTTAFNYSFYLKIKPLHKLRTAIEALADPTFNDDGLGKFEAAQERFSFLLTNKNEAIATLSFKPSTIMEFQCYTPIFGHSLPLNFISEAFPHHLDTDHDTVLIFHLQGSNQLCFEFGSGSPPNEFSAEFKEITPPAMPLYPSFNIYSGICIPVADMREMIDYILQAQGSLSNEEPAISIVWKNGGDATFEIVNSSKKWEYDYGPTELNKLEEGETYEAMFNWSYTSLLKEASRAADQFGFHFLTYPDDSIMIQFHMIEIGELVFIKKALMQVPHPDPHPE